MLTFHIFNVGDKEVVYRETVKFDPSSIESVGPIEKIRKEQVNRKVYVQPEGKEEVAFLLEKRKRGRAGINDAIVLFIFEQFTQEMKSISQIRYEIFRNHNMEISRDYLVKMFKGQSYKDVAVPEKHRQIAKERLPKPKGRKTKITDEMRQQWVDLYNDGLSGNEISKRFNVSSVSVNTHLRRFRNASTDSN